MQYNIEKIFNLSFIVTAIIFSLAQFNFIINLEKQNLAKQKLESSSKKEQVNFVEYDRKNFKCYFYDELNENIKPYYSQASILRNIK